MISSAGSHRGAQMEYQQLIDAATRAIGKAPPARLFVCRPTGDWANAGPHHTDQLKADSRSFSLAKVRSASSGVFPTIHIR